MYGAIKKYKFFAACALLAAVFSSGVSIASGAEKLKIITTIFPQYDFIREIAGNDAEVSMLIRPGTESHSFEPTPRDMIKLHGCDLFVCTGGKSDEWARRILESADEPSGKKINAASLMDIVETVEEEITEGMEEEEEAGEEEPEYDEHVWTSPVNAIKIVNALTDKLCDLDGEHAPSFRANAAAYVKKLESLDGEFRKITAGAKRRVIVFGDRFPFRYLADEYGLKYYAAFPGCSTETEASAATLAFLIGKVKTEKIPVVFFREFSNEKIADAICENTGAKSLLMHSCHNISKKDFDDGAGYLELMSANAENLREALN